MTDPAIVPAADPAPAPAPAVDPAPAPDPAAATIAGSDPAAPPAPAPAPKAGDPPAAPDWRTKVAGEDKDFLKTLGRYASEADFGKAHRALHQKLSSGEYKRDLAATASEEEKVAWRKEQGIPETWEKYDAPKLADGLVLAETDKPVVDLFTQFAHSKNWTPGQRDEVLSFYYQTQDALASQRDDADADFKSLAEDTLRTEWGPDFRPNLNAIGNVISQMPGDLGAQILAGRTFDGKKIGDDPRFMKWFAQVARDLDPAATLVAPGNGVPGATVETRLAEIRKFAQENPDKYDRDHAMQKEQQDLIDVQQKMQRRNRAA